jgi:TolB-like protein/DNA-binding winged helix-turn-helix (wHTH) protein/Tfp pilus assembly protein PilF
MVGPASVNRVFRFGPFELNVASGELRKSGITLKLRPQAAKVLVVLATRPGEMVTREQIKEQIWGSGLFVDFEHGLNLCVQQIRAALDDDADKPRYVETVPRHGYRFIARVEESVDSEASAHVGATDQDLVGRPQKTARWWRQPWAIGGLALAVLVIAVALSSFGGFRERLLGRAPRSRIASLAVLPLANLSGDPEQEYFADGITEELTTDLGQISALRVISRTSAMQYKDTKKKLPEIARELDVDAVVEGAVQRAGNEVRITAQLVEARADRHLWAKSYERDVRDVLTLQGEVAQAIANEVKIKLAPPEQVRLAVRGPVNADAYELYLRGRYYLDKRTEEGLRKALENFQDAVQKDPNSALPYAGLADTYIFLCYFDLLPPQKGSPDARVAALKALKLDPDSVEAHAALARVMALYEWDWQGAEREFQRAIELNPSYAMAHQYYGLYLSNVGRHSEAIAEGKKAVELDPLSLPMRTSLGSRFYLARQYDHAIEQYSKILEMDANFSFAHLNLGWTYVLKKTYEQGTAELLRAISLSGREPEALSKLAYAYAASGHRSQAQKLLIELSHMASQRYVPPLMLALIYVGLGDQTRALAWLEKSYQDRSLGEFDLLVDAGWDPLRSDPRFRDLLRRMNLPVDSTRSSASHN